MPLSPDGIAMCQTRDFKAQAYGEGIHGRSSHPRRRSGKERDPVERALGVRVDRSATFAQFVKMILNQILKVEKVGRQAHSLRHLHIANPR